MTAASPARPGGQYFAPLLGVAVLAVVAGVVSFLVFGRQDVTPPTEPSPDRPTVTEGSTAEAPEPQPIPLSTLGESDALVRDLVAALTPHSAFAAWLIPDHLVRLFVVVAENVADGTNPSARLTPLRPTQRFQTSGAPDQAVIDPASYARYNTHAEIVASIDPVRAAALYRRLAPLIDEAYMELGHPAGAFDDTLRRALVNLLRTPVLERAEPLVPRMAFFEFADADVENLMPVQKQFMGMGPRNVRAVQASLRDIARELGFAAASLPTPAVIR
ncbi:MAG: DUF3014 domain-containing protein [Acidobacteria bacterium]|nr:DUF3014 domain-containing protein [Acidobacteriota bacterium]